MKCPKWKLQLSAQSGSYNCLLDIYQPSVNQETLINGIHLRKMHCLILCQNPSLDNIHDNMHRIWNLEFLDESITAWCKEHHFFLCPEMWKICEFIFLIYHTLSFCLWKLEYFTRFTYPCIWIWLSIYVCCPVL